MIGFIKAFLWIHLVAAALVELFTILMLGAILLDDLLIGSVDHRSSKVVPQTTMTALFMAGFLVQVLVFIDTCRVCLPARRKSAAEIQIPRRILWCGIGSMVLFLASAGMALLNYPNSPGSWQYHLLGFLPFLSAFVFIGCCFGLNYFGKRYPVFHGTL